MEEMPNPVGVIYLTSSTVRGVLDGVREDTHHGFGLTEVGPVKNHSEATTFFLTGFGVWPDFSVLQSESRFSSFLRPVQLHQYSPTGINVPVLP